jgi:hypothetical protein
MYKLFIHGDAEADLESLRREHQEIADEVLIRLQELQGDQELLDALTDDNFGANQSAEIHVRKWARLWKAGQDIWRLKFWKLADYGIPLRIVYAYLPGARRYYVLAVVHKEDINYDDPDDPLSQRILRAYWNLVY